MQNNSVPEYSSLSSIGKVALVVSLLIVAGLSWYSANLKIKLDGVEVNNAYTLFSYQVQPDHVLKISFSDKANSYVMGGKIGTASMSAIYTVKRPKTEFILSEGVAEGVFVLNFCNSTTAPYKCSD